MEINKLESTNDLIIANVIQTLEKTLNNQDLIIKLFNISNVRDLLTLVDESLKKESLLTQNFEISKTVNINAKQCYVCEKLNNKTDFFYCLILEDQTKHLDVCSDCSASLEFNSKLNKEIMPF